MVPPVFFLVGDYVIVRLTQRRKHKLFSEWIVPNIISFTRSDLIFEVEDFLKTHVETVHAQRLILYPVMTEDEELRSKLKQKTLY